MPASHFLGLLEQRVSPEELRWVSEALSGVNCAEDGYGIFQSLVWGRSFSDELRVQSMAESLRIRFGPGEGYWIHDGTWLHGRGYLSQDKATFSRLHRLTYATHNFHARDVQPLSSIDLDFRTA